MAASGIFIPKKPSTRFITPVKTTIRRRSQGHTDKHDEIKEAKERAIKYKSLFAEKQKQTQELIDRIRKKRIIRANKVDLNEGLF